MSLASLLSCCGFGRRRQGDEIDERTPLVDPDALPQSAPQAVDFAVNTEDEVRHQAYLRKIVDQASERIISINAQAPLLQVRPITPHAPTRRISDAETSSTSDDHPGSSWRAVNGDTPAPNGRYRPHKGTDASAHSLRTFQPATDTSKRRSRLNGGEVDDDGESSAFDTVRTYRTAEEPPETDAEDAETERGLDDSGYLDDGPPPLQSELVEVTADEDAFASVEKLEAAVSRSFDLGTSLPTGAI